MSQRTVTVKGVAGLGNRIITLGWASGIARRYNSKVLVDWSDGQIGPIGFDLFSTYFYSSSVHRSIVSDWRVHGTSAEAEYNLIPNNLLFRFLSRIGSLKSHEFWLRQHGKGPKFIWPFEIESRLKKHAICAVHLPSAENATEIRRIFFNKTTCRRFDAMIPDDIEDRCGIHIRHSDKKAGKSFESVFSQLQNQKIFLATDSALVKEYAISTGLDVVCMSTILHDGEKRGGVHHLSLEKDLKIKAFEEGALDMFTLTKCQSFYGQSNSSFSRVVKLWRGENRCSQFWDQ